jgi:hypothetical protein
MHPLLARVYLDPTGWHGRHDGCTIDHTDQGRLAGTLLAVQGCMCSAGEQMDWTPRQRPKGSIVLVGRVRPV